MPELSILDARLAEIDHRLRMIQSGLEPVRAAADDLVAEPPPPAEPLAPPPPPPMSSIARRPVPPPPSPPAPADSRDAEIAVLTARLSELTAAHERLLTTGQELLAEQADMLARATPAVSLAVGPFPDTRALQEFKRAVSGLPHVSEVVVREYVGSEGVVLDVQLKAPIS